MYVYVGEGGGLRERERERERERWTDRSPRDEDTQMDNVRVT